MQAVKVYKTPSQLKGERYLRSKNLLVPPSTQRNIERVKLKARALRLKEEYRSKYLTRRTSPAVARRDTPAAALSVLPEDSIILPDYNHGTSSTVKRTLTFCITLWLSFLIAIAVCTLAGYTYKYILFKYHDERRYYH
jgi:hypothetical protein